MNVLPENVAAEPVRRRRQTVLHKARRRHVEHVVELFERVGLGLGAKEEDENEENRAVWRKEESALWQRFRNTGSGKEVAIVEYYSRLGKPKGKGVLTSTRQTSRKRRQKSTSGFAAGRRAARTEHVRFRFRLLIASSRGILQRSRRSRTK